jgi:Spy/CpxP family protein refolding chaperone
MPRHLSCPVCAVVAAVLLVGAPAPSAAQSFKWWQHEKFQRELVLSPEQVTRLEEIFQAAGPAMRTYKAAVDKLQAELSAMVQDARADEATATELIIRVEAARGDLGRTRALMLYRMRRVLTSDQSTKLKVLFDEHARSTRGHTRPRPGA